MVDCNNRKEDILNRLKKIEGQVKGVHKMVSEEKCCTDVMVQISAVRSAMNKVGGLMMDNYIKSCLKEAADGEKADIDDLINNIVKYVK